MHRKTRRARRAGKVFGRFLDFCPLLNKGVWEETSPAPQPSPGTPPFPGVPRTPTPTPWHGLGNRQWVEVSPVSYSTLLSVKRGDTLCSVLMAQHVRNAHLSALLQAVFALRALV